VQKWLANPKDFKSEARMPKFWYNTNNSGVQNGVDWDKRNVAEINAIVAYLWDKSSKVAQKTLPVKNTNGNAAHGKEVLETRGCYGCHAVGPLQEAEGNLKPGAPWYNLANQGSKVSANWIANWVADPQQVWHESKMPTLRLSDSEVPTSRLTWSHSRIRLGKEGAAADDAQALDNVVSRVLRAGFHRSESQSGPCRDETRREEPLRRPAPDRALRLLRVSQCSWLRNGSADRNRTDGSGSKLISQLDFGFLECTSLTPPGSACIKHERAAWYEQKLHDPRIFDKGRVQAPGRVAENAELRPQG